LSVRIGREMSQARRFTATGAPHVMAFTANPRPLRRTWSRPLRRYGKNMRTAPWWG
jgi:hypothetical protein